MFIVNLTYIKSLDEVEKHLEKHIDVLIENQLVEKYDYESLPLHTEYELTEKGKSLMPILKDLNQWGKECLH